MQSPSHPFAFFSDPKYFEILHRFSIKDLEEFIKKRKNQKLVKPYISNLTWTGEQQQVLNYVDSHLADLSSDPAQTKPIRFILTGFAGNFLDLINPSFIIIINTFSLRERKIRSCKGNSAQISKQRVWGYSQQQLWFGGKKSRGLDSPPNYWHPFAQE